MSTAFTCNSCLLTFPSGADQRDHMKTEWHRYNLKRKVAQLPPLNEELFNEKVRSSEKAAEAQELLRNKKNQKKNRRAAGQSANAEGSQEELTEEEHIKAALEKKMANKVDLPITSCFFCSKRFTTPEMNAEHMFKKHGLYIPERKYLTDLEGLLRYLSEKIGWGNMCLWCSFEGRSVESVRAHMVSKGHCKIPYDTEEDKLEISEFYDFSASYEDGGEAANDEEWVDVSGGEEDEGEEGEDEEFSDSEVQGAYLTDNGYSLVLPSGVKLGHRALARYYKQSLPVDEPLSEGQGTVLAADDRGYVRAHVDKVAEKSQKMAWKESTKVQNVQRRREGKNINNQPHYRDQLLQ